MVLVNLVRNQGETVQMAMDIENFVDAPGRAEKVKEVRKKIKELKIDYIYISSSRSPAASSARAFLLITGKPSPNAVSSWFMASVANLYVDRYGDYIGYGPESSELIGIPDPDTFVQLPWDKRVARVYCTCFRNREEPENPGGFFTGDCRGNLRRSHDEFQKKHKGLHMRHGTEPEMMWLKYNEDGRAEDGYSKPYLLSHSTSSKACVLSS